MIKIKQLILFAFMSQVLVFTGTCNAMEYAETEDCPYPSTFEEVPGEGGQTAYIVHQDPRCNNPKEIKQPIDANVMRKMFIAGLSEGTGE